jgi:hypothetical protein
MARGLTGTVLWACMAGAVGVGLFFIKHEVKDQEHRLIGLNAEIQRNQEAIHVLKAEWSYLNDPSRLRELSEKHLGMHVLSPTQVATLDTLPHGPVPAHPPAIAAAPPRPPAAAPLAKALEQARAPVVAQTTPHAKALARVEVPKPAAKPAVAPAAVPALVKALPPAPVKVAHAEPAPVAAAVNRRIIVVQSPALAQNQGASEPISHGEAR